MFFVDTHCHLDLVKNIHLNPSIEDNLPVKTISVTNAPFLFEPNSKLFLNSKNIRVALGMHPELVSQYHQQLDVFETNVSLTKYIGEIGLDGSPNHKTSFSIQKQTLESILSIVANADNKILTIHSRGAASVTIDLLNKFLGKTNCKVILHWYSGSLSELKEAVKYGFYFSINHKMIATAKGNEIIKNIPIERLLTETDAPFTLDRTVATRLDSLKKTIDSIATSRHKSFEEMRDIIFENFKATLS